MAPHAMSQRYSIHKVVKQIRRVDFKPHCKRIDGLEPNQTAICLTQAPTREAIAQKIQAMHNSVLTNPPITKKSFNRKMQVWEEKLHGKLATIVSTINLNMGKCMEVATATLKVQTACITMAIGAMAMEF